MKTPVSEFPVSRNIKLLIEYEGTAYVGWQWQEGQATVQGELMRAIQGMTGEVPTLHVAGRTDAGVHARAQVVNFKTPSTIALKRFPSGLNRHLPPDISVHQAEEVPESFNAKKDSLSKRYRYRIYRAQQPAALERDAWHRRGKIALEPMREAAALLLGELDFNAFRSTHCDAPHAIRLMHSIDIHATPRPPLGEHIDVIFHANAYCRHMCRILAGTLVEVGMGRRTVARVAEALVGKDRRLAGVTAPAAGLTLLEVRYPET